MGDLFEHWELIEADLADRGIDVGDDDLMTARSWRWLRVRIVGLLSDPKGARLQEALAPPTDVARTVEN